MNQKRILLFEDDEGATLLTKESLETAGYRVETALSGKEGLDLVRKDSFEVMLIDQDLPDMTGLEVYQEISKIRPWAVCIMVTGSGNEEMAVEAMKAGMDDYIVKAVNVAHLATLPLVIERGIERQRLRKERNEHMADLERRVSERTRDLQEKTDNLERYRQVTVGRELEMIELKKEINALLAELGRPTRYKIH